MAEFEDKLNEILSSPQAMEQIMSLAGTLSQELGGEQGDGPAQPLPSLPDPALLNRLMPLLSVWQQGEDDKTRLLEALRPFLRQERAGKLEQAIRITRLSRVIRAAMGLLRGDEDV